MKKGIAWMLAGLMLLSAPACAKPAGTEAPSSAPPVSTAEQPSPEKEDGVVQNTDLLEITKKTVSELPKETLHKVIQETALAYYRRDPDVQYEAHNSFNAYWPGEDSRTVDYAHLLTLTASNANFGQRAYDVFAPEEIWKDQQLYVQCTLYIYNVYANAFCTADGSPYAIYGAAPYATSWAQTDKGRTDCLAAGWSDPYGVGAYCDHCNGDEAAKKAAILAAAHGEPGDILFTAGHAMLCVGDVDGDGVTEYLHSWPVNGGCFTPVNIYKDRDHKTVHRAAGEHHEDQGALEMLTVDETGKLSAKFATGSTTAGRVRVDLETSSYLFLFRPLTATATQTPSGVMLSMADCRLTSSAALRLAYNGLDAVKYLQKDGKPLMSTTAAAPGEKVTLCLDLTNHSTADYTLRQVAETAPEGVTLLSDATVWTDVKVPAGETVYLRYEVQIPETMPGGTLVVFPEGSADGLATRRIELKTTSVYPDKSVLSSLFTDGALPASLSGGAFRDLEWVKAVYREMLGLETELPDTVREYLAQYFDPRAMTGAHPAVNGDTVGMFVEKTGTDDRAKILQTFGGVYLHLATDLLDGDRALMLDRKHRAKELGFERAYLPGDVLVGIASEKPVSTIPGPNLDLGDGQVRIYLYLGRGAALRYTTEGVQKARFGDMVTEIDACGLYFGLRPSNTVRK